MLGKILSKEECAKCKFCCSFRRQSLWESPFKITAQYKTDNQKEEIPCDYLNKESGCTLRDSEKPFDCKIWPLRIMRDEQGDRFITVSTACPAYTRLGDKKFLELLNEGLSEKIIENAKNNPSMIKPIKNGYKILLKLS